MVEQKEINFQLTTKQLEAFRLLTNQENIDVLYGGAKGGGKLQPLDTPISTPCGWKLMKDLTIGDLIFGEDGNQTYIVGITETCYEPAYKLTFSDGSSVVAGERHLWKTMTFNERRLAERRSDEYRNNRRSKRNKKGKGKRPDLSLRNSIQQYKYLEPPTGDIRTTQEIVNSLYTNSGVNHSIEQHKPLQLSKKDLLIHPYVLGAWLGDGTSSNGDITGLDNEIFNRIRNEGFEVLTRNKETVEVVGLSKLLKKQNLYKNKHIPIEYLRSSYDQRLALIQGIMDTDGWCDLDGSCAITLKNKQLFKDVVELLRTLGIIVNITECEKTCTNSLTKARGKYHSAKFVTSIPVFFLKRKAERQNLKPHKRYKRRFIVAAEFVGIKPMRCIQVSNPDGMYLTGESMVPTHNSWFLCVWAYLWSLKLIRLFGLKPSDTPLPVGFLGRKRAIDFTKTTLETWKATIPQGAYKIREMHKEIVIADTVKIMFGGLDDTENINKFNSAELCFVGIDQAEETDQDDVSVIEGSLRRTHNGIVPPYKTLYTANPRQGWLKKRYFGNKRPSSRFVRALPSDNRHLPKDYSETLKNAFGHNPALLAAYLYGDWDVFEGMYFDSFDRRYHVYDPNDVVIQPTWTRFRSIDWGYASPMACLWHAVAPDRHVYTYREWYKTRVLDVDAAKEIDKITKDAGETIEYTVVDPQSFPVEIPHYKFGKLVPMKRSEVWSEQGIPVIMGDSTRVVGWSLMRDYLRIRDYMGKNSSWWHISSDCTNLIDEALTAVHDKNRIEDISASSTDHALESSRLFLMSRPPLFTNEENKQLSMLEAAERQHERNKELQGSMFGA